MVDAPVGIVVFGLFVLAGLIGAAWNSRRSGKTHIERMRELTGDSEHPGQEDY